MSTNTTTPEEVMPHLLVALGALSEEAPGSCADPHGARERVFRSMGILDQAADLPQCVDFAFRQLRDQGMGRYSDQGGWSLTDRGTSVAKDLAKKMIASGEGSWGSSAPGSEEDVPHLYSDDPYIRGLAVGATPCFGGFSSSHDVCASCPLRRDCVRASSVRKARIAEELAQQEVVAKKAAEDAQRRKDKKNASIDELMASMGLEDSQSSDLFVPPSGSQMSEATASVDALCIHCNETIKQGARCWWIKGEGLLHVKCVKARS